MMSLEQPHRRRAKVAALLRYLCARSKSKAHGQGLTEVALLMPVVLFILLGVIDYAQVTSAQQRLERAVHLATLRLASAPMTMASLETFIEQEGHFTPGSVPSSSIAVVYSVDSTDNSLRVTMTATYDYPLMIPGIRNIQTRATSNGKLHLAVQAAGIATTAAPNVTQNPLTGHPTSLTLTLPGSPPGTDQTTPSGLHTTCTLHQPDGSVVGAPKACSSATFSIGSATGTYTATITQDNGVVSPPKTYVVN